MSFRPRGGGGGPPFPRGFPPQQNQFLPPHMNPEHYQLCRQLNMRYPPDPDEAYGRVMDLKTQAEVEIRRKNFHMACMHYCVALQITELFPMTAFFPDEYPKLLCNRSMMFRRMREFGDAENDAKTCISLFPRHIKAYWRGYEAVTGGPNGTLRGLAYLLKGFPFASQSSEEDLSDFLSEICLLIPNAGPVPAFSIPFEQCKFPGANSEVWMKVLRKLGSKGAWESISMLITGIHRGPATPLQNIGHVWSCSMLSVGSLLSQTTDDLLRKWGIRLAVQLLDQGASVDEIAKQGNPTLLVVLDTSLRIGKLELLEKVLNMYQDNLDKLNATNSSRQTVLHMIALNSRHINPNLISNTLDLLLRFNCDPSRLDSSGKKAKDYLQPFDPVYQKLQDAEKTVEELKEKIELLKLIGNSALKEGRMDKALQHYSEAIQISQKSKELFKEAAKLYSNRANVYVSQEKYTEALENAIAAINCDDLWHKGYYWLGKAYCGLGVVKNGFQEYMKGYKLPELPRDKISFLEPAVLLLKDLQDQDLIECYEELRHVDVQLWPAILTKLSKAVEWKCIAYLLFGTNLGQGRFGSTATENSVTQLLTGVAGKASTETVNVGTVFAYLTTTPASKCSHWLDAAVLAVHLHGNVNTLQSLRENDKDTLLSALTRFALLTGRLTMLDISKAKAPQDVKNGFGDTLFHVITKMRPVPDSKVICEVTNILLKRGYSAVAQDSKGKRPIDYLDRNHGKEVFDLYMKQSALTRDGVNKLKEEADQMLLDKQFKEAIDKYTEAITMIEGPNHITLNPRERAALYANRAEGFFKLKSYEHGKRDAEQSLRQDPNWYKAHVRLGRCLCKMNKFEEALNYLMSGYNKLDQAVEDRTKVDLLRELCVAARQAKRMGDLRKRLSIHPRSHLWAMTAYELILRKDWITARDTFSLVKTGDTHRCKLSAPLRPICDIKQLKANPWALNLIEFLLSSGADKKTLSFDPGDTYLHAVVRITLVVVCESTEKLQLLDNLLRQCSRANSQDVHQLDANGNTLLHTAAREHHVSVDKQQKVILLLLQHGVDPTIKNRDGKQAVDLLPRNETPCHETLRMAKYSQEKNRKQTQAPVTVQQRPQGEQTTRPKQDEKRAKKCEECNQLLGEALACFDKDQINAGYEKLVDLMMKKHTSSQHETLVNKALSIITQTLGKTLTPAIPNFLTSIPQDLYIAIIDKLAEKNLWRQLDQFVRKYRANQGSNQLRRFATKMTVVPLLRDPGLKDAEDLKLQIMNNLLISGATIGGDGGETALKVCQECDHYKVLTELMQQGADSTKLSMKRGDTPIHAAVTIVLEKTKTLTLLELLLKKYEDDPAANSHLSPDQLDSNDDCLFHLVARVKYSSIALKVVELLCKQKLSAQYCNKDGKLPIDYLIKKTDRRRQFLQLAAVIEPKQQPSQSLFSDKKSNEEISENLCDEMSGIGRADETVPKETVIEVQRVIPVRDQLKKVIEDLIENLAENVSSMHWNETVRVKQETETETEAVADTVTSEENRKHPITAVVIQETEAKKEENNDNQENVTETVEDDNNEAAVKTQVDSDSDDEYDREDVFEIDAKIFDNLDWEVECTADVWKTLRDRHVPTELKRRIIRKIQLLASGDWQPILCKKLTNTPIELKLFEAKFSKGSRILWELAVAFSPRCSESPDKWLNSEEEKVAQPVKRGRIYSEIIRVWDIVLDHDKIHRSVEQIKKSHKRGEQCIIQKRLQGMKSDPTHLRIGSDKCYPRLFAEEDVTLDEMEEHKKEVQQYFPPASANDAEFHILKFYTFSSALVSHVLQNIETKVDFPFRVTDLEHDIINLHSRAPILLLGRSGTGKTTCCMYRLWSQFHKYWSAARGADAPLLPRCVEFVHREVETDKKDEDEEKEDDAEEEENIDEMIGATGGSESGDEERSGNFDHIHQVFITKNAVLCREVEKNFRELSHADDLMDQHVQHEIDVLPSKLQDIGEYSFPLFITSKQLLLLLDASVEPPSFFERKEDGSLKVEVTGWMDNEGPLGVLALLNEDSDDEDEEEEAGQAGEYDDFVGETAGANVTERRMKTDPRREITYAVFVEEVWPRIKKSQSGYHPSLVWTEIMSFIKGSYEALSKNKGFLQLEDYIKLGKKRAPNFTGNRETVYKLFKKYEHFKRQHQLFDETDLVYNVYTRLATRRTQPLPWVIHQIYVDETQDFTQAELCLLIRLCQNPNGMFLTGDTAQSIMRGISFRFSDLRSLFYHAKDSMLAMGKTSAIEVPKQIFQLTHNYRSHAGILSLASSILELMVEFFPESFDRLQPDQGLFHGPQPILLESCSFGDLAVLLRGNRRKTSHIEFGAHQAILVANDATRDAIPEELRLGLVLTIYESKGLEFDDVLLYNFFKDSQANKEWRVVTDFLERLAAQQQEKMKSSPDNLDNLQILDEDVLHQEGHSRPLTFDPNLHKVLNSELKQLYTALTRARVNVWIFDEDEEKRKPMFEYFKARKLVKSLTVSEINEASLAETMFAEKSSAADWCRRGDDFMRHYLYGVAAKCFRMGFDQHKEKIALAHEQALKASRMKDKPALMRHEFLRASQLYLECGKAKKAAICLQNARERELSAKLFEKLGELERAAELYRRLNRPLASSRCYEQLGNFNKALQILTDYQYYELAIDTLKRYELRDQNITLPVEHQPDKYRHTEEKLCHRAANLFLKNKSIDKMLEAVEKFKSVDDRVLFLKEKGFVQHAAETLDKHDKTKEASELLLRYGEYEGAIDYARKTLQEEVIGQALLVSSRVLLRKKNATEEQRRQLMENLKEAQGMFESCGDMDRLGEVCLLVGRMTKKIDDLASAWKIFKKADNFAGLLEVANVLMQDEHFHKRIALKNISESIGYMFRVCQIMLQKSSSTIEVERLRKICILYGIYPSAGKIAVYPREKPHCLKMIANMFTTKDQKKDVDKVFDEREVQEQIIIHLLSRTKSWLKPLWGTLENVREKFSLCSEYSRGNQCSNETEVLCQRLHHKQTKDELKKLLDIDFALVKLEANVLKGEELLKNNCPEAIINIVNSDYFAGKQAPLAHKFKACHYVLDDILPSGGHNVMIADDSRSLLEYLVGDHLVQNHFKQFIFETWQMALTTKVKEDMLTCTAARSTEDYLRFLFGFHLFQLSAMKGKTNPPSDPRKELVGLETLLLKEYRKNPMNIRETSYAFMICKGNRGVDLQCVAHKFFNALNNLCEDSPDPYYAVFQFYQFVVHIDKRKPCLPDFKNYLMWLEFFITIAMFIEARLKKETFSDFIFILPSHFIAQQHFVSAVFPRSLNTFQMVGLWKFKHLHKVQKNIEDTLTNLVKAISGESQRVQLLEELVKRSKQDGTLIPVIERYVILVLILLCNTGKAVSAKCEPRLLHALTGIEVREEFPERLSNILRRVRAAKGIVDIAQTVRIFFEERAWDEKLLVCSWVGEKTGIRTSDVDMALFSDNFLHSGSLPDPAIIQAVGGSTDILYDRGQSQASLYIRNQMQETWYERDQLLDTGMPEDEIEKGQREKAELELEVKRTTAANTIIRFFRQLYKRKQKTYRDGTPESCIQTMEDMFIAVKMDEHMCGWCGVDFRQQLEEKLKLKDVIIGSRSVLNSTTSDSSFTNAWSHRQDNEVASKSEDRGRLLEKIQNSHKNTPEHIRSYEEFCRFKEKYSQNIAPVIDKVQQLINHGPYKLLDKDYRNQHYSNYEMEISRMVDMLPRLEQSIQKHLGSKDWSSGELEQCAMELLTDFQIVKSHVEEVTQKQEENAARQRQVMNASAIASQPSDGYSDDEGVDIERVVEEPKTTKRHGRVYRNQNRNRQGRHK